MTVSKVGEQRSKWSTFVCCCCAWSVASNFMMPAAIIIRPLLLYYCTEKALLSALYLLTRLCYRVAIYIKRFQIKRGKKFDQKKSPKIGEKRQATTFCKGKGSGKALVGPTDMTFRWKSPRMTSPIWCSPKNRQKIAGKSRNRKTPFLPDVMMKCLI